MSDPDSGTVSGPGAGKTLVFVLTEDWYFLSHRLPMARAAQELGFRVVVATRVGARGHEIESHGFVLAPIPIERGSMAPHTELRAVFALLVLFWCERPAIIHNISIKPIVLGGLAASVVPKARVVNSFTGLGSVLGEHAEETFVRRIILGLMRRLAQLDRVTGIVQNDDDRSFLLGQGLAAPERLLTIRGSGIDIEHFSPSPEPEGPPVALFVSRLLRDKGILELIEAARLLKAAGSDLIIRVVGDCDPANPNSVGEEAVAAWRREGIIEFLGRRNDIAELWRDAHIAVLPSYREGTPKSLLEAAAGARPLVTTDVPGCRDLVPDGATGILVPARDPAALAEALSTLAEAQELRRQKGLAARRLVEERYANELVARQISRLYARMLATDLP